MATMSFYSLDDAQMQQQCTYTFEAVIWELVKHGEISSDQAQSILGKYAAIHAKRGLFGRAVDALFKEKDDDKLAHFHVKLVEIKR